MCFQMLLKLSVGQCDIHWVVSQSISLLTGTHSQTDFYRLEICAFVGQRRLKALKITQGTDAHYGLQH